MEDKSYSLAVFIDYENLALGTGKRDPRGHQRPGPPPQMNKVLERLVEKGRINVKRAYCDWQRFSGAVTPLHELGIELIEIPDRAHTGKNSADIRLSVDAMEVCFTKEHIDVFVICSGDSDFSPLVAKLKEHGKHVIGVGMKEATSSLLVHNCDEFIYYEDIGLSLDAPEYRGIVPSDKEEVYRLLFTTVEALNRENIDRMQASLIKDAMRRKRPEFSESNYGYRNFTQLLQEAERYGFIVLSMDKLSGTWCVEGFNSQPVVSQSQSLVNRYSSYKPQRNTYGSYRSQQSSTRTRKNDSAENSAVESGQDETSEQETKKRASSLLRTRKLRKRSQDGQDTQDAHDTAEDQGLTHEAYESQEQVEASHAEHEESAVEITTETTAESKPPRHEADKASEAGVTTVSDQTDKDDKPASEQKKPGRKRSPRKKAASQPETEADAGAEQESIHDEQSSKSDGGVVATTDQTSRDSELTADKTEPENKKTQRSRRASKQASQQKDTSGEAQAQGEDTQSAPQQEVTDDSSHATAQPEAERSEKPKRTTTSTRKRAASSKRTAQMAAAETHTDLQVQAEQQVETKVGAQKQAGQQSEVDNSELQKPARKTRSRKKSQPSDAPAEKASEVSEAAAGEDARTSPVGDDESAAAPSKDSDATPAKKTRRTTRKKTAQATDVQENAESQESSAS